jgi:hypothetical protein
MSASSKFRAIEFNVKQKSLVKQCYSLITAIDKEFDLTDYMTKPAQSGNSKLTLVYTMLYKKSKYY